MVGIYTVIIVPFNPELNPICHLLALLGAHHILHFSRIRVNVREERGILLVFFLWRFNSIPDQGFPSRVFAVTLTGHTKLRRIPLGE